jgi:hypothetical protein
MKHFIHLFIFLSMLCFLNPGNLIAQEETGVFNTTVQYRGNNSHNPDDISGLTEAREITQEEIRLKNEIRRLREMNDRSLINKILELESQLEALTPNAVSKPAEYYDGGFAPGNNEVYPYIPEAIGNVKIFESGTKLISSIATATEQIGATAGRIWVALSIRTTGSRDSVRVFFSDNNGVSWNLYANGWLADTDQINYDQMDMEIIENTTGEKYLWVVYGYRNDASTGRWRTGGFVIQTPTFAGNFFTLSWPGDDATKRYYRARITSDNTLWPSLAYVYIVASFDSIVGSTHTNTQKTLRCTNPYTISPTFNYKGDKFWWFTNTNYMVDLHSDIAFFRNTNDSIIVSYSNIPDSTKLFFAKGDNSNGPGTADGAGGFIGGSEPNAHKQFARISSNGNSNGSILCVFRQNTNNVWRVKHFRTVNYGNFNTMVQSVLLGSATSHSYQPDIVGKRNKSIHYYSWRVDGTPDSLYYAGISSTGTFNPYVTMMNGLTIISGTQGPKPGFRYVDNDSCFVIFADNGPFDVWAAFGCTGPVTVETNEGTPDNYALQQNYPNPFNPSTIIKFSVPELSFVRIKVFNMLGQEIADLVNEELQQGNYEVKLDAANLPSGVYFYRLEAGNFVQTRKMVLTK